jgi:hypothetical protein
MLNYQGLLKTSPDSVVTGMIEITFRIYESGSGGTPLWEEKQSLELREGLFHTLLGGAMPFPEGLFSHPSRFLAMTVNGEEELLPRQQVVSVAFAIESATADSADYARKSGQAIDVSDRDITPRSWSLSGGKAALDSSGILTTKSIQVDSLTVGSTGVIDRNGNWTGKPINANVNGMVLDTVIVKNIQDTLGIATGTTRWRDIAELTSFIRLESAGLLEVEFRGTVTVRGGLEIRLVLEEIVDSAPTNHRDSDSNVSGIISNGSEVYRSSTVSNAAVYYLEDGLYRVFVETRINGSNPTLNTGTLIMKIFARR